jgi:large subunit ribosomal protein L25
LRSGRSVVIIAGCAALAGGVFFVWCRASDAVDLGPIPTPKTSPASSRSGSPRPAPLGADRKGPATEGRTPTMAEAVTIQVEPRDPAKNKGTGTRVSRKLRAQGRVPAIIYGHKKDPVPISLTKDDVAMMLKKSVHLAQLAWDGSSEMAVVRDVQWDHLGKDIIHLDFLRVSAGETVESEVAIEVHGEPVGLTLGGRLEQIVRSLKIKAKPTSIPKEITIEVGHLKVGQAILVRDLKKILPEGVETDADESILIVHVVEKKAGSGVAATDEEAEGEGEGEGAAEGEGTADEQSSSE